MSEDLWIVIPNWERFQHYKNRNPAWIKLYTELSSDPDWDRLTLHQKGLLVTIWLEYARSRGQVGTHVVRKWLGRSFKMASLFSLSDAGFIELTASRPLAQCYSREEEDKEKEPSVQPSTRPPALWDGEEPDGLTGELEQSQNGLPDFDHVVKEIP